MYFNKNLQFCWNVCTLFIFDYKSHIKKHVKNLISYDCNTTLKNRRYKYSL